MRFLFTCIPGLGHFHPLVPLAEALARAGHTIAFATAPAFAEVVTAAGLEVIPAGMNWDERHLVKTVPELGPIPQMYRGEWIMKNIFLDRSPRSMVPDLLKIIAAWRPDMIVAGSFEYGAVLAAERAGIAYANANYTIRWHPWILKLAVGRAIGKLRKSFGLPEDPDLRAFGRHLDLCFAPPSWTFESALLRPELTRLVAAKVVHSDLPLRQRASGVRALLLQRMFARVARLQTGLHGQPAPALHFVGQAPAREHPSETLAWLKGMPRQPIIFVSLGTVLSADYPEIFEKILAALEDQPVNLVLTLGGSGDPARFGPRAPNIRILPFLTQEEIRALLPLVALCINHAGYSSVMEALLHGIPLVLFPLVSDAPMNTQMCLSSGVAPELQSSVWGLSPKGLPVIRPEKLTPEIIREAAMKALHDPSYRNAARRLQRELADRLSPDEAVGLLEQIVCRHSE